MRLPQLICASACTKGRGARVHLGNGERYAVSVRKNVRLVRKPRTGLADRIPISPLWNRALRSDRCIGGLSY